jgi:hypothetical protein
LAAFPGAIVSSRIKQNDQHKFLFNPKKSMNITQRTVSLNTSLLLPP